VASSISVDESQSADDYDSDDDDDDDGRTMPTGSEYFFTGFRCTSGDQSTN